MRFRVGSRTLVTGECFDAYWEFAAERQSIFHRRICQNQPPWTTNPIIAQYKFTNVYRASDRVSQYLINQVIGIGSQDVTELAFRTLLFKVFNRVSTWELLTIKLGHRPSWDRFDFYRYDQILTDARSGGTAVYSPAYLMPTPPLGERNKHSNHLRLIEQICGSGLPKILANTDDLGSVYQTLVSIPSIGPFLAYQYTIDLAYSGVTPGNELEFVVPGPGALDGISKCFLDTAGFSSSDLIKWTADTSHQHFERLGLTFVDLWGRWPTLIDWQNVYCETSKYTRVSHPDVSGVSGRTKIKQKFKARTDPVDYRFPAHWGLPDDRTVLRHGGDS